MKIPTVRCLFVCLLLAVTFRSSASETDNPQAKRPLIGITSTIKEDAAVSSLKYARAVYGAGGMPVILPIIEDERYPGQCVGRLDGLVVIGGGDIPPEAYGQKPHPTVKTMPPARWRFARKLIPAWLETGKPMLGVCLGAQMTNVVRGGSMVQDIPSLVGTSVVHRRKSKEEPLSRHVITIEKDSLLWKILRTNRAEVNSSHHQAVDRLGKGIRVVARSEDGVAECLEIPGRGWRLLVQWHPEQMEDSHRGAIFGAFVEAAARTKR